MTGNVGPLEETSDVGPPSATVTRSFDLSAEIVFDAWLVPELIERWMFGQVLPDEVLHIKVDPRVGGAFSFLVRREGEEIDHVGTYRVIERPNKLVFTWGIAGESDEDSVVTITIDREGAGCRLTLVHELDPAWAAYVAQTEDAWTKMIDVLATRVPQPQMA